MSFGLSNDTIAKICAVFAQFPEIERAIIYGSRAQGNDKKGSDIDLSLIGKGLSQATLYRVLDALDELLLPYGIDLSIFEQIDQPALREHIQRVGSVFYQRTPGGMACA